MIWNPKKHPRTQPSDVETAQEPEQVTLITAASRKNLVALIDQTAQGVSANVKSTTNGILCVLGDTTQPEAEARFDHYGLVRDLAVSRPGVSLYRQPFTGNAVAHAQSYLSELSVQKAFRLQHAELVAQAPVRLEAQTRVDFKQFVSVKTGDEVKQYPVRGGHFFVLIDAEGKMTNVGSTVRHGSKPRTLGKVISAEQASTQAKGAVDMPDGHVVSVNFEFSAHEGKLDPIYAVTVTNINLLERQQLV